MHYAEVPRPPSADFGALWGLGRKKDHTKWQWEAPAPPKTPPSAPREPLLPSWLTEFEASEIRETDANLLEQTQALQHVRQFCESLRQTTKLDTTRDLCSDFNERFAQSIRLGQVSDDVLALSIRDVPNYIRQRVTEEEAADRMCLSFLRAIWNGISESKVLQPADVGTDALQYLFLRLQRLPLQFGAPLFTEVLDSINAEQKKELKQPIFSIANATLTSGTKVDSLEVESLEKFVHSLGSALSNDPSPKAMEHVRDLARISTSYVALSIHRHLIAVSKQIRSGATGINPQWARIREVRKTWLKLVARLPYASESLIVEACRIMEAGDPSSQCSLKSNLSIRDICDVVLEFWSAGPFGQAMTDVRVTFEAAVNKPTPKKGCKGTIVQFVKTLELHTKLWRKKTEDILRMLRCIRGPESLGIFHCLRGLEQAQIYLRASTLAKEIDGLVKTHPTEARTLFDMYSSRPIDALGLEEFPGLAKTIVEHGKPDDIWNAMGGDKMWQEKRISEARIDLVLQIALKFAQAEGMTSRMALRNLTRCYHYLCYHKVNLPAEISQLITKVGLERNILEKGAISNGRLSWVLGIVSRAESVRKADLIEEVLERRKGMMRHQHRDPLGRGPIG